MKWWEYFGSLFLAPYLWFKGKSLKERTERAINIAGCIGVVIILFFLILVMVRVGHEL